MNSAAFTLELFHGPVSPPLAQIYARVSDLPGGGEWRLQGRLRGPHCQWAQTLPAITPLVDLGVGKTLLARADLADPCVWTTDLPAMYRAELELLRQDRVVQSWKQWFGLRSLGVSGRSCYWYGKRWVLRGLQGRMVVPAAWYEWRDCAAAMVLEYPDNATCAEASEQGVVLVARVRLNEVELTAELRRLAQWPAVAVAWIETAPRPDGSLSDRPWPDGPWRTCAPNLLLATSLAEAGARPPDWCQLVVVDGRRVPEFGDSLGELGRPVVAWRPIDAPQPLADVRAACDRLQRDLAPSGDMAGYLV